MSWSCPDPRHKPYRMSPKTRIKVPPRIPACPGRKKIRPKKPRAADTSGFDDSDLPF